MKYLAILKDSVREAIDTKVIFVMVGLSLLLTLFVLTCSFTPLPTEKVVKELFETGLIPGMGMLLEEAGGGPGFKGRVRKGVAAPVNPPEVERFGIVGVEPLDGKPDEPESRFRITVALPLKDGPEADRVRQASEGRIRQLRGKLNLAVDAGYFTIADVRLAAPDNRLVSDKNAIPNAVYFEVVTEPAPGARLAWGHEYGLFLGAVPLSGETPLGLVLLLSVLPMLWIGSVVTLLVSIIITAFFIPNMLRKGTVDLLLVKPVRRWALLVYKYIGGLTFILVNTTVTILGLWLALGLRAGVWADSFLVMIFVYTFFFAVLYAISTLFAVLTRSSVVAILMTCGIWFILFLIGLFHGLGESHRQKEERFQAPPEERTSENGFFRTVRAIHFVLPRTSDLNELGNDALARDFLTPRFSDELRKRQPLTISWGESITVSLAFIVVLLGLSCWRFSTKDF